MSKLEKVLYTAQTHATGGRDGGIARSIDGRLEVRLSSPGGPGNGTNPEQLFAAGWSACFLSAVKISARKIAVALPGGVAIDAEIDLGPVDVGYGLAARLDVNLPGVDRGVAQRLIEAAEEICPYSRATRGNVEVEIKLV